MCYIYDKSKGGDTRELQSRIVPPKKTGSSHLNCQLFIYQLTTIFLAKYQLTFNPFRTLLF